MKIPYVSKWFRDFSNTRELQRRRSQQASTNTDALATYRKQLMTVSDEAVSFALVDRGPNSPMLMPRPKFSTQPYVPPFKNVVCPDEHVIAMDANLPQEMRSGGIFSNGGFPGFTYLTELTQINEYRDISEATAKHMTRKWIKLRAEGEDDLDTLITDIENEMRRLHVKEWFQWAARMDGFMGRAQLFLDFGDEDEELSKPLAVQKEKIQKGSLKRIKGIEPITTYPAQYNSDDPTAKDYYEPSAWFVYSKEIHTTRFLTFISRPVPDLLKPVYCFSGISLSQLAMPYVDYWLQTRDSVGRLLKNFSTTVFKTDMSGVMQGTNFENFKKRLLLYTAMQNNQGVFMLDKETEELTKESTSLSGLDKLQAQAQEHMASVAKTPLTVLFGLSPVGLTATAETDITIFNNHINTQQEAIFRRPLETLLKIIQLSLHGSINEAITFDFVDLVSMNEKDKSAIRTANGTTDQIYIQSGVVSPKEVRARIASDPESGYDSLDVDSPDGKLIQSPAAPAKGGKPGASGAPAPVQPESEDDEEDDDTGEKKPAQNKLMQDAALLMLQDAQRVAMDAGMWLGNQHTGTIGTNGEHASVSAMKHSTVATKATSVANRTGSRGLHEKAVAAHQRALDAHKRALLPATGAQRVVHQSYIDAHKAAIASHRMESAPTQEEVLA